MSVEFIFKLGTNLSVRYQSNPMDFYKNSLHIKGVVVMILLLLCFLESGQSMHGIKKVKKANLIKKFLKRHKKLEGTIKLVDGLKEHEGNVEIYHLGRWGNVCDDEWDEREANVVCKQLGYEQALKATHSSHFGQAKRKFWMDNIYCTGEELSLDKCRFDGWGSSDCAESEAAGVICYNEESLETTVPPLKIIPRKFKKIGDLYKGQMQIQLVGGRYPNEGRVEVRLGSSPWGLICGDGWSILEAAVVCRQLELGYASDSVQTDYFGGNRSSMTLSGVQCHGNEISLEHCVHTETELVQCPGREENIAAVTCSPVLPDLIIDHSEIQRTAHLEDRQLYFLQCAMEENCLASSAYKLQQDNSYNWHLETRRLVRFTARILNAGTADFQPYVPKHMWEFHQCHMHYHSMEVFATFDILNSNGVRVAEGHKASFCLEDNQCLPGVKPVYACANFGDQGISVNCSDIYRFNIDCQWVDITDLTTGLYTFKVSINPEFKVAEISYDNNAAVCTMYYSESYVNIYDCYLERP